METNLEESALDIQDLGLAKKFFDSHEENSKNGIEKPAPGRNPLHLALAVSPLYLLMPIQLLKLTVGRRNLLNVSHLFPLAKVSFLTT